MTLGFTEILVILIVALLLFGAKRIPEIARSLGRASHEFKKAKEDFMDDIERERALKEAKSNAGEEKTGQPPSGNEPGK